jgi:hypothetical protein
MVAAAECELTAAGVSEKPRVVVADAGYWHHAQMDDLAGRGITVLVPPDSGKLVCAGYRCVLATKRELAEASTGVEMGPVTLTPCEVVSLRSPCCDCPLRFVDESSGDPSHLV